MRPTGGRALALGQARSVWRSAWLAVALFAVWEFGVRLGNVPAYLLPPPTAVFASLVNDWKVIYLNIFPDLDCDPWRICPERPDRDSACDAHRVLPLCRARALSADDRLPGDPEDRDCAALRRLDGLWRDAEDLDRVPDRVLSGRHRHGDRIALGSAGNAASWTVDGRRHARVFLKLRLPNALPNIFAGLKVAITLAVVGAITGEFVGSQSGLGYLLTSASGQMDTALVFAVLVTISVIAMILFMIIEAVEKVVIPWHSSMRSRTVGH